MSVSHGGISFRADPELREAINEEIERMKAEGEIPEEASRSDLFRHLARQWADDPDPEPLR